MSVKHLNNFIIHRHEKGFTLIEVLVTLVIISISVVALAILQLKNNARVTQTSQSYLAEQFISSLFTEISTSNYSWYSSQALRSDSPFFKAANDSFPSIDSACNPQTNNSSELATAFLSCWSSKISKTMDVDDTLLKKYYFICQSNNGETCTSSGSLVLAQMAWYSKECDTLSSKSYTSINSCATDATTGVRLFKAAIQP